MHTLTNIHLPMHTVYYIKVKWISFHAPSAGQHFWYNISTNMNCDDFFPAFALYNKGKLNAFGWVTMGDFQSSRYEHPPPESLMYVTIFYNLSLQLFLDKYLFYICKIY